jgi:hypothetical protein
MAINPVDCAVQQIRKVKFECEDLLKEIKSFSLPDENGVFHETFRLLATPILYSTWERCFTLCHAIALRLIRDITTKAGDLSAQQRTVWLLKSSFYNSLVDQLKDKRRSKDNTGPANKKKEIKKGEFFITSEFLSELDQWLCRDLDQTINTDDLVMTFSNVTPDVVEVNAHAIGINNFKKFAQLTSKLGRLHDLVGQRNDIGHGSIIKPPENERFQNLFQFTENLVNDYCIVFIEWIESSFSV